MTKRPILGMTMEFRCSSCAKLATHEVIYVGETLHHQRCRSCKAVCAYVFEDRTLEAIPQQLATVRSLIEASEIVPYRASDPFQTGWLLEHPKFGIGYVLDTHAQDKMEVLFEEEKKTLVCGPGSGEAERLAAQATGSKAANKRSRPRKATGGRRSRSVQSADTKDDATKDDATPSPTARAECPKCGRNTHPQNLFHSPDGMIVGCMWCC